MRLDGWIEGRAGGLEKRREAAGGSFLGGGRGARRERRGEAAIGVEASSRSAGASGRRAVFFDVDLVVYWVLFFWPIYNL